MDTCLLTHALAHMQAVDARQQGGGTPVPERGEAILGRTPRDFLSPALGTSLSEHLLSLSHSSSPTRLHVTRRPAAPEEHGQQGGGRQPCCRPPRTPPSHATWCLMTILSARDTHCRDCQGPIRGKIETLLFSNSLKQHKPPAPVIIMREPSIADTTLSV